MTLLMVCGDQDDLSLRFQFNTQLEMASTTSLAMAPWSIVDWRATFQFLSRLLKQTISATHSVLTCAKDIGHWTIFAIALKGTLL